MTISRGIREPAARRLMALPAVFGLHDLRLGGFTRGAAKVAVNGWKSAGYVIPAGPRLGVYYNLIADRRGIGEHLGKVLREQFGAVVIVGPTVLNEAGWTTQIPHSLSVAVPQARSYPKVDGATIYPRPPEWFAGIHMAVSKAGRGRFDLHSLPPSWALADAIRHGDCLHDLGPDDIDIPQEEDARSLMQAFDALGLPQDSYLPFLEASDVKMPLDLGLADKDASASRTLRR